jgi:hypothetical protein
MPFLEDERTINDALNSGASIGRRATGDARSSGTQ